jgi:hypothetical protein
MQGLLEMTTQGEMEFIFQIYSCFYQSVALIANLYLLPAVPFLPYSNK